MSTGGWELHDASPCISFLRSGADKNVNHFPLSGTDFKIQTNGCDDDDENCDRAAGYYAERGREEGINVKERWHDDIAVGRRRQHFKDFQQRRLFKGRRRSNSNDHSLEFYTFHLPNMCHTGVILCSR